MHARSELQPFLDQLSLTGPIEPFLVFADWLQSKGDSWGELIVMQCRELELESYTLLTKVADQLCPRDPLVGVAWQRGFVGTIAFADSRGTDWLGDELARLFALPVTALCLELSFGGAQIGDDDVRALLRVKPHLERIPQLDLEGNWFSPSTIAALQQAFPKARLSTQRTDLDDEPTFDRNTLIRSWAKPGSDAEE